jgi:hypothetical protein
MALYTCVVSDRSLRQYALSLTFQKAARSGIHRKNIELGASRQMVQSTSTEAQIFAW